MLTEFVFDFLSNTCHNVVCSLKLLAKWLERLPKKENILQVAAHVPLMTQWLQIALEFSMAGRAVDGAGGKPD